VNYPNTSTKPVEDFYKYAERTDRRLQTFEHLAESDPAGMMEYYKRHESEIMLAEMFRQTRSDIADLRQGIEDLRNAPPGTISEQEKRDVSRQMQLQIIELSRMVVDNFESINRPR